jgi:DNA-binding transcriptional ArsR family regulator
MAGEGTDSGGEPAATNQLLAALRHPLRRQILQAMSADEEVSPGDLALRVGAPLSNVSYHVRVLADCSAITLVDTRPGRGSVQHFYRLAIEADWARRVLGLGITEEIDGEPNPSA